MARQKPMSSEEIPHPRFLRRLRSLRPADAAFVFHLTGCERCRRVSSRFLAFDRATAEGDDQGLSAVERDIFLDLTRGGYLFSLVDAELSDDLPPSELRRFLQALSPEHVELIRHLLDCANCRRSAAKILAPQDRRPAPPSQASSLSLATVLS